MGKTCLGAHRNIFVSHFGARSYTCFVLTEYVQAAMRGGRYELMENGRHYGAISQCEGVWGGKRQPWKIVAKSCGAH